MNPSEIISGHTIAFDHGIAMECGINAAIIYNHIIFWLKVNKDKPESQHEGKVWMYSTQEKMAEFFQFFDEREVKYCIKKLVDVGLLEKKNFNKNPFDHTNWYSLPDPVFQKVFPKVQKCTHRSDKNVGIEEVNSVPSEGVNFVPSTYIEEKEKINNAAGAAAKNEPSNEIFESISYRGRDRQIHTITKSEIYRHFSKSNFSAELIHAAILKFQNSKALVGDPIKLIESIIERINYDKEYQSTAKSNEAQKSQKNTNSKKSGGPPVCNAPPCPREKVIEMFGLNKKRIPK